MDTILQSLYEHPVNQTKILQVHQDTDHLVVTTSLSAMRFHFLWLRDNAPNSHSSNAQKLHESNTIESSIRPKNLAVDDYGLRVVWNDNTHAEYPVPFLCEHAYDVPENNNTPATLWDSSIAVSASVHQYHEVRVNSIARRNWLNDVVTNGFSLLANVPAESGKILEVVELFGHVRETNYGKLFDVKVQEAATILPIPTVLSVSTQTTHIEIPAQPCSCYIVYVRAIREASRHWWTGSPPQKN